MTDNPAPQPREMADLLHDPGAHWQIEHPGELNVWTAVRRSPMGGTSASWSPTIRPACAASWRTPSATIPARATRRVQPSPAADGSVGA